MAGQLPPDDASERKRLLNRERQRRYRHRARAALTGQSGPELRLDDLAASLRDSDAALAGKLEGFRLGLRPQAIELAAALELTGHAMPAAALRRLVGGEPTAASAAKSAGEVRATLTRLTDLLERARAQLSRAGQGEPDKSS